MSKLGARNDRQLSMILNVAPPSISKMRHGRACVSAEMLIRMHDASQLSINELREMMKPEIEKKQ
jgi:plasmid maintenance system antidote protein VapI